MFKFGMEMSGGQTLGGEMSSGQKLSGIMSGDQSWVGKCLVAER